MPNERFMRHHYGPSGYVPPTTQQENQKKEEENANERFEVMAELFKASTGFLAPGKSVPVSIDSDSYQQNRQIAWGEWSDTKALNMAIKFIQALRHKEEQFDKLYEALIWSDTNQLRQERDALRLRIKTVDEEHVQLTEERKKMIDAYTKVEKLKNFWEREHKALMETCLTMQKRLDQEEELKRHIKIEYMKLEAERDFLKKERDQYKRLWELRGKALARPCASCGHVQEEVKPQ